MLTLHPQYITDTGNPKTTDRATINRQKNDPKCQPHI